MLLTERDLQRLKGVHPDLVRVVERAASNANGRLHFMVIQGLRTLEEQKKLFALGKSRTMKSRHLTGHAVDLAPLVDLDNDGDLDVSWNGNDFVPIAELMKGAAEYLSIPLEWGGDWKTFHDMPHFQLPFKKYP